MKKSSVLMVLVFLSGCTKDEVQSKFPDAQLVVNTAKNILQLVCGIVHRMGNGVMLNWSKLLPHSSFPDVLTVI
jgi:hypothetical protein